MSIENLKRAAEIYGILNACTRIRTSLSEDAPFTINGIELPHEMASNIMQVINLKINNLYDEIRRL